MSRERTCLIKSLKKHFVPALIEQGFTEETRELPDPVSRKYQMAFPLRRMVRVNAEHVEWIQVQLNSYGRPIFRITAGRKKAGKNIAYFEMYEFPRWWVIDWAWFKPCRWRFRSPQQSDFDALVIRIIGYIPELSHALREDQIGPHMRRVML